MHVSTFVTTSSRSSDRTGAGAERLARAREALERAGCDALVCVLPQDVLLLSGYWPVTGHSIAVVHARGGSALIVPEDERSLAQRAWVDEVHTFQRWTPERGPHDLGLALAALRAALKQLGEVRHVGYEEGPSVVPVPYAALHVYGPSSLDLVRSALPHATAVPAGGLLAALRATPTRAELELIRQACGFAADAFADGARALRPGMSETAAANAFREPLSDLDRAHPSAERADAFVYCMSGPDAEHASAAYQRSTRRRIGTGEPVLVHCNSYVDGYWTDITRTYCLGRAPARLLTAFEAVFAARAAGLRAVRPGVRAEAVDAEIVRALRDRGFGAYIRHGAGHGVGFAAIDHDAMPRLRPRSEDVLDVGMVMNVEPGVYGPELGGVRHCDMVCVTADGFELLTPFQTELEALLLPEETS